MFYIFRLLLYSPEAVIFFEAFVFLLMFRFFMSLFSS